MFKLSIMILELIISYIQNIKKCVIKPGVENFTIYVLIKLKIKMKANIVFSMKAKTHILNAFPKVNLFIFLNVVPNQKQTRTKNFSRTSFNKKSIERSTITR